MPDTDDALAIEEQGEITDAKLKDFFYAIRGLKRKLYTHVNVPTTKDPAGPKITRHRCTVCRHSAVGEAGISHHKSCFLLRVQELWRELKTARPDLFDFADKFPKKDGPSELAGEIGAEAP